MFQLTKEEYREFLRCQFGILEKGAYPKYPPFAFTEYGILMLSSVLNSERAIQVNIQIIRAFAKMKNIILDRLDYDDLSKSLENFELRHQLEIHEIHEILEDMFKKIAVLEISTDKIPEDKYLC